MNYYFLHIANAGSAMEGPYKSEKERERDIRDARPRWDPAFDDLFYIDIREDGKANCYRMAIEAIEEEWSEDGD